MKAKLTIGKLAQATQLNPKTIRYYEGLGLMPKPPRNESGYRIYSDSELERLRLIRKAKLLGLSLAEIKEIVAYVIDGRCNILHHHLLSLLETKLQQVDQKIQEMTMFKEELKRYHQQLYLELSRKTSDSGRSLSPETCSCIPENSRGNTTRQSNSRTEVFLGKMPLEALGKEVKKHGSKREKG